MNVVKLLSLSILLWWFIFIPKDGKPTQFGPFDCLGDCLETRSELFPLILNGAKIHECWEAPLHAELNEIVIEGDDRDILNKITVKGLEGFTSLFLGDGKMYIKDRSGKTHYYGRVTKEGFSRDGFRIDGKE